jgi:hypothetical protein
MFRIIRVPAALDNFFQPSERYFHWNHFTHFRLLVVIMALCGDGATSLTCIALEVLSTTRPASTMSFESSGGIPRRSSTRRPKDCCAPSVPARARLST